MLGLILTTTYLRLNRITLHNGELAKKYQV